MALGPEILKKMIRIEIVVNEESLDTLIKLFRDANVRGYTVIKGAGGLGSTGERNPDDYVLQQPNAVMVLACEENQAEKIIMLLHPELKDLGGMCLVSECHWVLGPTVSY
ncbi:transcriptional regulator [Nitrosomonas sp.]|uniref:P-II family nitrogen regulator n=1 Tax=Nitrosomonas sp. TaxID=42353 RepID=UPI00263069E1|nr:transcriptional regulator [Nitrosomonas sp.]